MTENYNEDIERIEAEQEENDDYSETPPTDIVAFNELRSCADLVRMYNTRQLVIKPDFQRDVVWSNPAQTRFIDSLVKQLPIPSMCLSLDYKTEERLMVDGLQRISSVIKFLTDAEWRLSKLEDIDSRISGRTSGYIKEKHFDIYSRIENLTIPVTVLRCDYTKKNHLHYLFTIFHRLNTGGNKLSNQEIRNCIYSGRFNELLKRIVTQGNTRNLLGLEEGKTYRFVYEELFLRVFAFADTYQKYNGRLAKFLNEYMDSNRKLREEEYESKLEKIDESITLLYENILDGVQLPKLSKATTESLLIGIYCNIDTLRGMSNNELRVRYEALRAHENYSIASLSEGVAATEKVKARISTAVEIFS